MKCKLCEREAEGDLCAYHLEAKDVVEKAYQDWVTAYGRIEWKEYLDNVKRNIQTGQWAKEIAGFLEAR